MIKFKAYKREEDPPEIDRRFTRVKNRNKLPVGVWAKWLVERIKTEMDLEICKGRVL